MASSSNLGKFIFQIRKIRITWNISMEFMAYEKYIQFKLHLFRSKLNNIFLVSWIVKKIMGSDWTFFGSFARMATKVTANSIADTKPSQKIFCLRNYVGIISKFNWFMMIWSVFLMGGDVGQNLFLFTER